MRLCEPTTCFTGNDAPTSKDACMCGFGLLNGIAAIWTAQLFIFLGGVFSLATMVDCSFATIDRAVSIDLDSGLQLEAMGVGFIFFQKLNGTCYWYNENGDNAYSENQLEAYWTILGDTWAAATALTWFCAAFAWCFFLYSLSFCCSSQVKCCRYLNGFLLAIVLSICQACTFVVYGSLFCDRNGCSFSRGSGMAIIAIICYIIAGTGFFLSRDYPGEERANANKAVTGGDEEEAAPEATPDVINTEEAAPDVAKAEEAAPDVAKADEEAPDAMADAEAIPHEDPETTPSDEAEAK